MMATGVLLFCISVWDRYLNFRSVQNLRMFILLSLYKKGGKVNVVLKAKNNCSKIWKLLLFVILLQCNIKVVH